MTTSSSSSSAKFLLGTLLGGLIGGVIGLLLAPRSGSETRSIIKDEFSHRYHDSGEVIREKTDLLKERASALKERVTDKVMDLSASVEEGGRQAINRIVETGREVIGTAARAVSNTSNNVAASTQGTPSDPEI